MTDVLFPFVALAIAGFAKGLVGLGLPPIAMGLLVLTMSPVEAAALMVIPALLTNLWQGVTGPNLVPLLRRFWLMFLLTAAGTLAFAGALNTHAETAIRVLGGLLIVYGLYALVSPIVALSQRGERWLAPISGALTGLVTAFTGVSSMPAVPFLKAVGLPKDAFIQAMGLSFSISALALIVSLGATGGLSGQPVLPILLATGGAFWGMSLGAKLRARIDEALFGKLILIVLIVLGTYLTIR